MNILQVLPELNYGGVETGTIDLTRYLVNKGHKVVVVSSGGGLVDEILLCGAIHYKLPVHKKSLLDIILNINKLSKIIIKEKIHVVHARSRVPAWSAFFAARRTSTPFITTCHGYYSNHPFSYVMGFGKLIIAPSQVIARHMIDDFGVSHEYIKLIPRSVDIDRFTFVDPKDRPQKEFFRVGIVGRISPIKGHIYFLKAIAEVLKQLTNVEAVIVGDIAKGKESYKEELNVVIRRLGLSSNVKFLGKTKDIPKVMEELDVLVLATTTHEAFGRVIIEAQAKGTPVVATCVGGVIDIIEPDKTGLLVAPKDSFRMAQSIVKILKDKEFASRLAKNARAKVEKEFNLEKMCQRTLAVYEEADKSSRILVIKLSALGDVILSVPSLKALREKFSSPSRITCLIDRRYAEALNNCPYIDEIISCDLKGKDKGLRGLWNVSKILRKRRFDMVVDLQNSRNSHILAYLSLSSRRYGYDNGKLSFFLNRKVIPQKNPVPAIDHQFKTLQLLDIEPNQPRLELWLKEADCIYVDNFLETQWLSKTKKIVGISLVASRKWPTKAWPLDYYAKLLDELALKDIQTVVVGLKDDERFFNKFARTLKVARPINACGKTTIGQLFCLIKKMDVFVGLDSAPLHIAAGLNVPVVALFGPTDPLRHFPPTEKFVLLKKETDCSPCYKRNCDRMDCMKLITPEEVLKAVEELIGQE